VAIYHLLKNYVNFGFYYFRESMFYLKVAQTCIFLGVSERHGCKRPRTGVKDETLICNHKVPTRKKGLPFQMFCSFLKFSCAINLKQHVS